jgi:WD40 repeat protein
VLEVSLKLLSGGDRKRLFDLSIFPEDVAIPLSAVGALWRLDEWETEEAAQRLAKLSLLKLDLQRGTIRVHDVMRSWLAGQVSDASELHSRLVEAWSDWHHLPNAYAWRWLPWHLARAGRKADLRRLLWDGEWLQAKLEATDTNALIADFEHLEPDRETDLVQGALRLSAHVLARDSTQMFSQLVGRLRPYDLPDFWAMAGRFRGRSAWLRPLSPSLTPPGEALLRTLSGHGDWVHAVAVYGEGKRAISASGDYTLKVWDLESGAELRTLSGHAGGVAAVVVYGEGKQAISASWDKTLKLWDLKSWAELRTLSGHTGGMAAVVVYREGKQAISASWDKTLKLWDLESGAELRTLKGARRCGHCCRRLWERQAGPLCLPGLHAQSVGSGKWG